MLRAREDAIVSSVNRLLADKGYDVMTVDEVAADVGIAKASLYKHFPSKEALAAAAMIRMLDRALAFIATLDHHPFACLQGYNHHVQKDLFRLFLSICCHLDAFLFAHLGVHQIFLIGHLNHPFFQLELFLLL